MLLPKMQNQLISQVKIFILHVNTLVCTCITGPVTENQNAGDKGNSEIPKQRISKAQLYLKVTELMQTTTQLAVCCPSFHLQSRHLTF